MECKLKDEDVDITAIHTAFPTAQLITIRTYVLAIDQRVALDKVTFAASSSDANVFTYEIKTVDGRKWDQTLYFGSSEEQMSFEVGDLWSLSEFSLQRPIRDFLVDGVNTYGLTSFVCKVTT